MELTLSLCLRMLLAAVIAYLLGSISTGMLVSRAKGGPDLRSVGSGGTGATNATRALGAKLGLVVFLGDAIKAILACLIGRLLVGHLYGMLLAGLMVVIGHNWPCFFQFRGGKGVASSVGVMLVTFPIPAIICDVTAILLIALTRYVSVGSLALISLFALLVSIFYSAGDPVVILWCVVLAVMCIARHHANLRRLMQGEENKLKLKK